MNFIRETMKKSKGVTLLELIVALSISSLIITVVVVSYGLIMKSYKEKVYYSSEITGVYEALMYIDNHVNYSGEGCLFRDGDIIIPKSVGADYVSLDGNELRVFYKNKAGMGHTYQPLLYGVKEFSIVENGKVLFIKIVTNKGISGERAIGKI
jgi:prepilin-type N-terminal cleavage/methylation domain-containing protein